jgi:dihydropteroate synthase
MSRAVRGGRPGAYLPGLPRPARCLVMGVVNTTPDSFSDGGLHLALEDAVRHGVRLAAEGADIVDVGGESTRPGAARVPLEEELRRVVPVVGELAAGGVTVSVDTMRAEVAAQAVAAGAVLVNDVSGGKADPVMLATVAELEVPYVLMHWRGHSSRMASLAVYDDVVSEVRDELTAQVDAAVAAGIDAERICLDPGIGFAKTAAHNWEVLRRLDEVVALRRPVLVATSRKRFLGELLAEPAGAADPQPPARRDDATTATTALAAAAGAWCVRVHAPAASADATRVVARWYTEPGSEGVGDV